MLQLILIIIALVLFIYNYVITPLNYWRKYGVNQCNVLFILKHTYRTFSKKYSLAEGSTISYKAFPNARYIGIYQFLQPILLLRDPELIKEITVKSFDSFMDHTKTISENVDPLWVKNLVSLRGQKWKEMRSILSPTFTSSKMRTMFALISECAEDFSKFFLKNEEKVTEVEMKNIFTKFTNDVIATTAFGIKVDSLNDETNEFYMMGKEFMNFSGFFRLFKFFFIMMLPRIASVFRLTILDKRTSDFFYDLVENSIKVREEKGIVRPDMIHLLMEAKKGSQIKEENITIGEGFAATDEYDSGLEKHIPKVMTTMDIVAQAVIFFLAGFETVSTSMCFFAYELAANQDCQKKLREEIEDTLEKCNGNLTYEALLKMKYLDMCISEALRKWPPAILTDRQSGKSYTIQPKLPSETPIKIKKNLTIWIPVFAIHRDSKYYPDPEKFDPERFNDENKGNINPYTYLPFGLGPRNCIGSRFALLEIKMLFFHLLKNFEIVPTAKSQIPLKISRKVFNMTAEDGFWFGLKRIQS